jgi:hypothetical protein
VVGTDRGARRHAVLVKRCIALVRCRSIHLCVINARHVRVSLCEHFFLCCVSSVCACVCVVSLLQRAI